MAAYLLPDDGSSALVAFDLTMSEGHHNVSKVTEHPVEQGSNVADHIRQETLTLTLDVFVTNTPIEDLGRGQIESTQLDIPQIDRPITGLGALIDAGISAIQDAIFGPPPAVVIQSLTFPEPFDRVKEIFDILTDLERRGVTVSAVTSLKTYDNMAIENVDTPITEPGGAMFNLSLKQIRVVQTATVTAPKPKEPRGAAKQNKGGQATKPAEPQAINKASILVNIGQGIGLLK